VVHDVLVVGAGFGGLGAALTLAEGGARVVLCESLAYPGGCASTFTRRGWSFETGATLFAGLGEGQLLRGWIARHGLPVEVVLPSEPVELRAPGVRLAVPSDRSAFVTRMLAAVPVDTRPAVRGFLDAQGRAADALWSLFSDPARLLPFGPGGLVRHVAELPRTAPLARYLGRSCARVLEAHGVARVEPLRTWLDAVCQITVQCGVDEAEALFAMAAMDYPFRGAGHVRGGIGVLAHALCGAITSLGGEVRLASRVTALAREDGVWVAEARGTRIRARQVVANVLPGALAGLLDAGGGALRGGAAPPPQALGEIQRAVDSGWGACMLYLGLPTGVPAREDGHHIEIVQDRARPYTEGNHLFASVSAADESRGPGRTVTVSTHVPLATLRDLPEAERGPWVAAVQARMAEGLDGFAPELVGAVERMTASPRTWARFTRRPGGAVGGIPRRVGIRPYLRLGPTEVLPGMWMIGDSVMLGQSVLATALAGLKTAERLLRVGR
jgi:phytoene dehydrogenase-like protein